MALFPFISYIFLRRKTVFHYTLKQISNWPLYKKLCFAIFAISTSKVRLFCVMHTDLWIIRKNTCFYVQNHPCGTVGAKISMCSGSSCTARLLSFLVKEYSSWIVLHEKTFNIANMSIIERTQAFPFTQKMFCTRSRKHERDVTSK